MTLLKEQECYGDNDDYYGEEVVSGSLTGFARNQVNLKAGEKEGESKAR